MRQTILHSVIAAAVIACALPAVATATTHDVAADFSPGSNPNGVWSFGYSTTLVGAFNLYTNNGNSGGLNYWELPGLPSAHHNPTSGMLTFPTTEHHAGQLTLHPGPGGEYSIARFTAQVAGTHTFLALFTGEDRHYPTTTDVHVLVNGSPLYTGLFINTFHGTVGYGGSLTLNVGDTIDAVVGYGSNGNYIGDTTGLAFRVEAPVPTPGAAAVLGLGALAGLRRRR